MDRSSAILERLFALHPKVIDLSLGRIERLLASLGHPERQLPPVVHVAGTNGKGSTVAFLRAMIEAAGCGVHSYTSPHLVRFHERIRLAGEGASSFVEDERLAETLRYLETANRGDPITFFEITTAAAIELFAKTPADYTLLEVGLGGRLDATNVVDKPAVSVVTSISQDHAAYLGTDLRKIAAEKAGILKRDVPAVIGPQVDEVRAEIELIARRVRAPLAIWGQDFIAREEQGRLVYEDEDGLLDLPLPRLVGRHQIENAGVAIAAVRRLSDDRLDEAAIATGMQTVSWPARLQRLHGALADRTPKGAELWLDGGHNADGGRVVAQAMAELEERAPKPLVLITGMLETKAADDFLRHFVGLAARIVTVDITRSDKAFPAKRLAEIAAKIGLDAVASATVVDALKLVAAEDWGPIPPRILICGSLYLSGEVLALDGAIPD